MADTKQKAEDAPEPGRAAHDAQRDAAKEAGDEPTLPIERFLGSDAYTLTGHEPHVMAGALHDVTKKNLTISEAKAAADAWLGAEVKEA